jgi:putative ABC transport system permease protein
MTRVLASGWRGRRDDAVQALPLSGNTSVRPYQIEGGPTGNARPVAHYRIITPGYIEAMRIRLITGRTFTDLDTADRPLAVIVNQTLARQSWAHRNPVGQRITFGGSTDR